MQTSLNILLPVKNLSQCKQRLATVLNLQQRQHLVLTLLEKNLQTLAAEWPEHNRLVITPDPTVAQLAKQLHVQVLHESQAQGLNAAVEAGTRWSVAQGYQTQLVLAPDIALLKTHELQQVFDQLHRSHTVSRVIIAAANDGGTNALLTQPPNAIPFQYGAHSAMRMYLNSQQLGIQGERLQLPYLALDIDTPNDVACWQGLVENENENENETPIDQYANSHSINSVIENAAKRSQALACTG